MRKVIELAQIEMIRRKNADASKRWSISTAAHNAGQSPRKNRKRDSPGPSEGSLSSRPVLTKHVSSKEASVMYELAPLSPSLSKSELLAAKEAKQKELASRINEVEEVEEIKMKSSPQMKWDGDLLVKRDRRHSANAIPAHHNQDYPLKPFPSDANALAADKAAEHDTLKAIRTEVTKVSNRTSKIEKTMEDITATLSSLNRLLQSQQQPQAQTSQSEYKSD
jgi:hypothetical protein